MQGFSREGAGSGLGLHFGWILRPFGEQLGAQNRKKGDPETLTKNDGTKSHAGLSGESRLRGGGRPSELVNSILQRIPVDPLSFHFVPQGHGGGYVNINIQTYYIQYIY